ncbi:MAG: peptidylprolyl isomerase [Candidatus Sulfotelmatobacter sp.]
MKRLFLVFIATAFLPALAAAQVAAAAQVPAASQVPANQVVDRGQVVEEIVTRVNGQIITRSEFQRSKDQLRDDVKQQDAANADTLYAEREKDVLRDLVDQQLLLEKGKDLGITGDTELIKRLDQMRKDMKLETMEELEKAATAQGISYEDFKQNMRNQIITQKVIGEEVGSHLSITKEEQQQFYDQHKNEMEQPESIRLSEILIAPQKPAPDKSAAGKPGPASASDASAAGGENPKSQDAGEAAKQAEEAAALAAAEAKAADVLKQIRAGASFEDMAKKYSDGPSAAQGGDLGSFKRGTMAKELEDRTFAMKSGDVTDVIRAKQGYVILKVTGHQMAGIPPMKDVEPKIQDALYYQKLQPALRAYLTKLREDAYIDYREGYVDSGFSPNQTKPIETAAPKASEGKKLKKKKKKLLGVPI